MKQNTLKDLSLPMLILKCLLVVGETVLSPFESPYQQIRRLHREALGIPEFYKWEYSKAIKRLEEKGKIQVIKKSEKIFLKLTKKGKLLLLLKKFEKDFKQHKKWDGKWRLVIWDIPEISRKSRNMIRGFVKSLGFYQVQKSVFITPFELPSSAVKYLNESGLIKYIRFFRIDKIDNDKYLRKYFNLTGK